MKRMLPLGTVLKLNPAEKEKVMIVARLVKKTEDSEVIWDYCGCNVPQGLADNKLIYFQHEQVKQLIFLGLQDEEELA
ncbi:DUF4176 domain-containing protein [Anaeromicropila populeti]|uniref:DUF4176 domain-containing protein n=1 Tax=Anaeromicropila populeti TaxID=37658 RepID=A0A1I6JP42_9FIRM|nr:DUF4176 domain-containing protein [Anaeromicropila populeti]SFR80691.1 protein of unknown function [Anaeromicropila populeti]